MLNGLIFPAIRQRTRQTLGLHVAASLRDALTIPAPSSRVGLKVRREHEGAGTWDERTGSKRPSASNTLCESSVMMRNTPLADRGLCQSRMMLPTSTCHKLILVISAQATIPRRRRSGRGIARPGTFGRAVKMPLGQPPTG